MEKAKVIEIQYYQSPCGELIVGSYDGKLCLCDWQIEKRRAGIDKRLQGVLQAPYEVRASEVITKAVTQLDEYFARERTTFDIPLLFIGTDFQKRVWSELLKIRAVAGANGANPISIFVPCHRVIGSNHELTGYGGGLTAKKFLLELESMK